jgi:hypothetical protein
MKCIIGFKTSSITVFKKVFIVYDVGQTLLQADADSLNKYPQLKQNREEVAKQLKIAEYLKNRPQAIH